MSRWVGLGLVVGIIAGLTAALFYFGMDWLKSFVLTDLANYHPLEPAGEKPIGHHVASGEVRRWLLVIAPAIGGLISGVLVFTFAPEAEGHGTDALIDSFHHKRGKIRGRIPLIKGIASVALIGTGGSAGREGPIAQVAAGIASQLGRVMKLTVKERRLLILAGAAAGIGAIFRTPLGAALFIVECLYSDDFEVEGLVPTVLASVVAYSVFTMIYGEGKMFAVEPAYAFSPVQLPLFLIMAVGAALIGVLYIKVFYGMRDKVFHPLKVPNWSKPMIGGLAVGLLSLVAPQALGAGYGWLQEALLNTHGALPVGWWGALAFLGIALLKVLTTSLSVNSGGSGGVFGPSVVIGGMVGGAFGLAFHELAPTVVTQPGAFVIVGMACFVGGVAHAPISTLVMASEMTGSYELLVPIMLAEVVTVTLMRRFTLYEKQVPSRRDSPAHAGDYVMDVLDEQRVAEVYNQTLAVHPVHASTSLEGILRKASESRGTVFPVVNENGEVTGIITLDVLREYFFDEEMGALAIAADFAQPHAWVHPDDTLSAALERFAETGFPQLPVCEHGEPNQILGLLGYDDVLHAYSRAIVKRRLEPDAEALSEPMASPAPLVAPMPGDADAHSKA
ncbi:MAG: chloride channel protein [Myxococcales bacterium]|nr:chloride channel protein [Myxococcales bacterium]